MLQTFLKLYWFAPPVALWRAVEARVAARQTFYAPMLDFGCGHGRFAAAVFDQPLAAGCDLLHFQLVTARDVGAYHSLTLADGHRLPYPDHAFATAFSNSVLEHIPDPSPVLTELARTLRAGGRLVITVPSDRFHDYLSASQDPAAVDRQLAHYHYHTPAEWAQLFHQAGLELVHHSYYMAPAATALWDRLNQQYGIGRRSVFSILVSPRLRGLGYQKLIARLVPRILDRRLRPSYEIDLAPGETGGGLLLTAEKPA